MAFHSCLLTACSYLLFKGFQIEFHAELKNEPFVQGHLFNSLNSKLFVIQTNCM